MAAERKERHPEFDPEALVPESTNGIGMINLKIWAARPETLDNEDNLTHPLVQSQLEQTLSDSRWQSLVDGINTETKRALAMVKEHGTVVLYVFSGTAAAALTAFELSRQGKDVKRAFDIGKDIREIIPNFFKPNQK